MKSRSAWRRLTWIYHLAFALAVVWPGQALVNNPRPFVLGLPFQIVWIAAWIIGSMAVFLGLHRAEAAARQDAPRG